MEKNCENCGTNKATIICHACNATLCQECDVTIHKFGIFSNHSRKSLEGCDSAGLCTIHNSRIIAVCDTCKETCCCECLLEKHSCHEIIEYHNALKKRQNDFNSLKDTLKISCEIGKVVIDAANKEIESLDANKTKTIEEINASFERVESLLKEKKSKLIAEIDQTVAKRNENLRATCALFSDQIETASKINLDAKPEDSISQSIEMEHVIMVIDDEVNSFIKKTSCEIETFSYNDKSLKDKKAKDEISKLKKDDDDVIGDVMDYDVIFNSFGDVNISPKYNSKKVLMIPVIKDPETGANRSDIDETSAGLSWDEGLPEIIKMLVDKNEKVVFVLEQKTGKSDDEKCSQIYTGKDLKFRAGNLETGKMYKFCVRCCIQLGEKSDNIEKSNDNIEKNNDNVEKIDDVVEKNNDNVEKKSDDVGKIEQKNNENNKDEKVNEVEQKNNYLYKDLWCSNELMVVGGGFPGYWKEGPYYTLSEDNKIATKDRSKGSFYGLALGNTPIPTAGITKWRFNVTKYCGSTACVGVAPIDADQSMHNPYESEGYYICTCDCELHSGPPYDYSHKDYVSGKVSTGGFIDVIVDMDNKTISFNCNGKEGGVAYRNIPTDKPLVPAAAFDDPTDSFEITNIPAGDE